VRRPAPLSLGDLIEHWTLREDELDLVAAKHADSKLPFALLLRFYGRYGRFPETGASCIRTLLAGGSLCRQMSQQAPGGALTVSVAHSMG
jgi:hypothetical protein